MEHSVMINGIRVDARYSDRAVKEIFTPLLHRLQALRRERGRRILAILAAPPGAGKSTLASFLKALAGDGIQTIGMDGFHRRQEYLLSHTVKRDGRMIKMVEIKGAPETFDLNALTEKVKRVAAGETCGWPAYDRILHNPVEDALRVDGGIVLLEGNYLLLDEDGWRDLSALSDYTVFIRAEEALLRARLIERRIKTGVDENAAARFVDFSDMPNARLCLNRSLPADLQLRVDSQGDYHIDRWDNK